MKGPWKGLPYAMGQDYSSAGPDHGQFDNTRWSMVLEAVQSRAPGGARALAESTRMLSASALRLRAATWPLA